MGLSSLEMIRIEEKVYKSMRYNTYLILVMYGLNKTARTKTASFSRSFLTVYPSKCELDFPKV